MALEKSQNYQNWMLLLTSSQPREFKVRLSYEKKYGMLIEKVLYVYDEDKLHMRKPAFTLNFDLHGFILEAADNKTLEFK